MSHFVKFTRIWGFIPVFSYARTESGKTLVKIPYYGIFYAVSIFCKAWKTSFLFQFGTFSCSEIQNKIFFQIIRFENFLSQMTLQKYLNFQKYFWKKFWPKRQMDKRPAGKLRTLYFTGPKNKLVKVNFKQKRLKPQEVLSSKLKHKKCLIFDIILLPKDCFQAPNQIKSNERPQNTHQQKFSDQNLI